MRFRPTGSSGCCGHGSKLIGGSWAFAGVGQDTPEIEREGSMGTSLRGFSAAANRCRSARDVSARVGVDEVDCRVAAGGRDFVTAEILGVVTVKIAEPLRVDDIDWGGGVIEYTDETKVGHHAEVKK